MVDELDASIVRVLSRELPKSVSSASVSITFATPGPQFPPDSLSLPAINFFLYALRQNLGLTSNVPVIERTGDRTVRRSPPPIMMDASYLVTVWTAGESAAAVADEHRILTAVLQVLMAHPSLPAGDLGESMKKFSPPACAVGFGTLPDPRALSGRQKLSTIYTVTFALPVLEAEETGIVTERVIDLSLRDKASDGPKVPTPPSTQKQ